MPRNIARLFTRHLPHPTHVLYRHCPEGAWLDVTVREVEVLAGRWQAAFRREGYVAGDRIALCARNGIDWVAIDIAALGLGLVIVPLYVDDNADNVAWCVENAAARLLIVESSRIATALESRTETSGPLPPLVVLRPDAGGTANSAVGACDTRSSAICGIPRAYATVAPSDRGR